MTNTATVKQTHEAITTPVYEPDTVAATASEKEATEYTVTAAQPEANSAAPGMFQLFRKYASFSDLLRFSGVVSVAVAMGMFLIDGAEKFNDLQRFLTMLGFTGALTAAGFILSLLIKEQRGSRVFLGLSLLSVPVNFAVFGAMLYSFIPLDGMVQNYSGFALWQVSSTEMITALAAGLAVLVPVIWMSYTVLARTARNWLTTCLLLSSAVLVIPVRHEIFVAALAVLTASAMWWFVRKNSKESLALKTVEGKFSAALLFVSPAILIGRGLFLYNASSVLVFMLSAGAYLVLRQLLVSQKQAGFLTATGTIFTAMVALVVSAAGVDLINTMLHDSLATVIGIVGFLVLNHDLTKVSPSTRTANTASMVSVILSVCALVTLPMLDGGSMLTAMSLSTLIAIAVYGYRKDRLPITTIATLGVVVISILHVQLLWATAMQTGWWGIAGLGVLAIVSGSLLDRAGTVVAKKAEAG